MVEICTKTMNLSIRAGKRKCWKAFPPITIETGYDLLTKRGRDDAFAKLQTILPDLIVAEWMCDPWSNIQNINLAKGGDTAQKILDKREIHSHLLQWFAKVEQWQRKRGAHWLAEKPHGALSWKQQCMLAIQDENYNAIADLCNWDFKDPESSKPYRKRPKLNTDSLYVHEALKSFVQDFMSINIWKDLLVCSYQMVNGFQ